MPIDCDSLPADSGLGRDNLVAEGGGPSRITSRARADVEGQSAIAALDDRQHSREHPFGRYRLIPLGQSVRLAVIGSDDVKVVAQWSGLTDRQSEKRRSYRDGDAILKLVHFPIS